MLKMTKSYAHRLRLSAKHEQKLGKRPNVLGVIPASELAQRYGTSEGIHDHLLVLQRSLQHLFLFVRDI
jgi:hypothetical protein